MLTNVHIYSYMRVHICTQMLRNVLSQRLICTQMYQYIHLLVYFDRKEALLFMRLAVSSIFTIQQKESKRFVTMARIFPCSFCFIVFFNLCYFKTCNIDMYVVMKYNSAIIFYIEVCILIFKHILSLFADFKAQKRWVV